MNIESQVCSLELSKRLKELGVSQESLFVWISIVKTKFDFIKLRESYEPDSESVGAYNYSAFTSEELGDIIFQKNYDHLEEMGYLNIITEMLDRIDGFWYRLTNNLTDHIIDERTEADARARLLIYLFESKL